jgi:acyl-coenzyme A synthetase/AMP-(fatty) acid ligase
MIDIKEDSFISLYKNTLAPSKVVCQKEFTFSGYSYGDVFELAAGLKKTLARRGQEKVLCLCTVNKAVTAACVLASLAGSCKLILPYSFSAHAVTEMYDATGFNFAIADHPEEMPAGVETIMPLPAAIENNRTALIRDPDEPFLCLFTGGSTGKPRVWSKSPRNFSV